MSRNYRWNAEDKFPKQTALLDRVLGILGANSGRHLLLATDYSVLHLDQE